jgi:hypothetical protein
MRAAADGMAMAGRADRPQAACRRRRHRRPDDPFMAGKRLRGNIGEQPGHRDGGSDQHPVDDAQAPQPGVAAGRRE